MAAKSTRAKLSTLLNGINMKYLATTLATLLCISANSIHASEDQAQLDKVTVTADKQPLEKISVEKLLKVPGSGNDPMKAISSLPGVVLGKGGRPNPAVRGSSPEDNGYIIDFIPVNNLFHIDGVSIINDNLLQEFDLFTGGFDAKYSNATGAVIDTTTRAPYQDQSQVVVDLSLLRASILVEAPLSENSAGFLSIRQSLFQYYIENFLDDEDFEFTQIPEYYDYQGKYQYRLNNTDSISLQIIGSKDKAGLLFADDSDEVKKDPGLKGGINFNNYFHSQAIVWDRLIGDGIEQITSFSHMQSNFALVLGQAGNIDAITNDFLIKSHFSQPINFEHNLRYGAEILQRNVDFQGRLTVPNCTELDNPEDCRLIDATETVTADDKPVIYNYDVFVADDWQISQDLLITPGLLASYDDYTQQSFFQPKLAARWGFSNNWWLNSSIGQYHKLPGNFGQYAKGFGNPDLKQPTADHYALGLEQKVSDSLLWKVDGYYKTFDNLVVGDDDTNYSNDADGYAYGMELFVNKNLTTDWYGWLSLAYAETHRKSKVTGEKFLYSYDQPWTVNLVSSYQLNADWTLGFNWKYSSGQLYTPVISATPHATLADVYDPKYAKLNSARLPDYHKLDIRLDRHYIYNQWEMDLYIEILNAYNRKNVTDYEYSPDYQEKEAVADLPLMPSFGVKASF